LTPWPIGDDPGAFGDLPAPPDFATARFAVLPIPYDGTATWQKGAARGPAAICAASQQLERYDLATDSEPTAAGIVTMAPVGAASSPARLVTTVRTAAGSLIDAGKTVVGLGGDHAVAIGLIQAHAARYPGLTVLQLDAHADTRDRYRRSRWNHACVGARAREVAEVVAVGIRSLDRAERARLAPDRTFFAHEIAADPTFVERVVAALDGPVYLTIDVDVLDPGEMPATGTPEPGGLSYRQVTDVVAAVAEARPLVGCDVCELMPLPALRAPDFLAARLVYQVMAHAALQPAPRPR
jgi:agmatinase